MESIGLFSLDKSKIERYQNFNESYSNINEGQNIIDAIKGLLYDYKYVSNIPKFDDVFDILDKYYNDIFFICKNPYTHLKTNREVISIDKVKKIGYEAVSYLASHPEDWKQKTAIGLKPSRLLSITNEIDYGIYENKVVKKLIDKIIIFLEKQKPELESKKEQIKIFSDVDKGANPNSIFGYDYLFANTLTNIYNANTEIEKTLKKAEKTLQGIKNRLKKYHFLRKKILYRNAGEVKDIANNIHKTNLFMFHKRYKSVFLLWNDFKKIEHTLEKTETEIADEKNNPELSYRNFCYIAAIYALNEMKFIPQNKWKWARKDNLTVDIKFNENKEICFSFDDTTPCSINLPNRFRQLYGLGENFRIENGNQLTWAHNLDRNSINEFIQQNNRVWPELSGEINKIINKRPTNKYILKIIPVLGMVKNNAEKIATDLHKSISNTEGFSLFAFPLSYKGEHSLSDYGIGKKYGFIPLSLFDINSYRRLRKIFLKILTTFREFDFCPYCGERLSKERNNIRQCPTCELQIIKTTDGQSNNYKYLSYNISNTYKPACPICGTNLEEQEDHSIKCSNCNLHLVIKQRDDKATSCVYLNYKKDEQEELNMLNEEDIEDSKWINKDSQYRYIDIVPLYVSYELGNKRIIPLPPK